MISMNQASEFDYVLAGGGLQSGLLALAIRHHSPNASVLLLEKGDHIAGNHTWSFHPGDVPESCSSWIEPLIKYRWQRYEVRFSDFQRRIELPYASIPSDHFASVVKDLFDEAAGDSYVGGNRGEVFSTRAAYGSGEVGLLTKSARMTSTWQLKTGVEVDEIHAGRVHTRCGQTFHGRLVIDCRGPSSQADTFSGTGFQKFYGFEIESEDAWPRACPTLMESSADQRDGFRFLYTLPFTRNRVLIEDTRFSDTPRLNRLECLSQVEDYLHRNGVSRYRIVREESGVLPMPFSSELLPHAGRPLAGGYAGGWFHAATGYSFPMAVGFADAVASRSVYVSEPEVASLAEEHRWRSRYARFLNRLLFRLVAPERRFKIFKRFYRVLGERSIERFYSHRFTFADAFRIVVGVPPTLSGLRPHRFLRSFFRGDES
ncbi:MAG: lycopene cyclase family protein [Planctomycetota bacterium]